MRDRYLLPCAVGIALMAIGVVVLFCAVPCRVWLAAVGIALVLAGLWLLRRCGVRH